MSENVNLKEDRRIRRIKKRVVPSFDSVQELENVQVEQVVEEIKIPSAIDENIKALSKLSTQRKNRLKQYDIKSNSIEELLIQKKEIEQLINDRRDYIKNIENELTNISNERLKIVLKTKFDNVKYKLSIKRYLKQLHVNFLNDYYTKRVNKLKIKHNVLLSKFEEKQNLLNQANDKLQEVESKKFKFQSLVKANLKKLSEIEDSIDDNKSKIVFEEKCIRNKKSLINNLEKENNNISKDLNKKIRENKFRSKIHELRFNKEFNKAKKKHESLLAKLSVLEKNREDIVNDEINSNEVLKVTLSKKTDFENKVGLELERIEVNKKELKLQEDKIVEAKEKINVIKADIKEKNDKITADKKTTRLINRNLKKDKLVNDLNVKKENTKIDKKFKKLSKLSSKANKELVKHK